MLRHWKGGKKNLRLHYDEHPSTFSLENTTKLAHKTTSIGFIFHSREITDIETKKSKTKRGVEGNIAANSFVCLLQIRLILTNHLPKKSLT